MAKPRLSNAARQKAFRDRKKNDPESREEYKKYIREHVRKHRSSEKYIKDTKESMRPGQHSYCRYTCSSRGFPIFLLPSVIVIQGYEKSYFQPAREP